MNKPTIDELTRYIPSKYTLAVLAAKRARQLTALQQGNLNPSALVIRPVSTALEEIARGKIIYQQTRRGIK
ncbi:MAG: DNA-directed RNA polymerase subunit omega [Clostridia bacterium]|nr:MAG: DNA-directed RNA polymerase subunit omega [Clostridia bacterium]